MRNMNFKLASMVALLWLTSFNSNLIAQDLGLIIPMPGQKQIEKVKKQTKIKKTPRKNTTNKGKSNGALIPLPSKIDHNGDNPEVENEVKETKGQDTPLIIIRPKPQSSKNEGQNGTGDDFPKMPDEIVIEPDSLTPLEKLPENEAKDPSSDSQVVSTDMPIFPKDTSSAVFMVMKTWQCADYDGNTLLSHAVEVYSQEADDKFQISGLSEELGFKLDLDEEDITLDELLDLIALKTGRDWGVDIPSKTIYFYPKGVKTDSLSSW